MATIPPDTRSIGSGNPPADMNSVADVLAQLTGTAAGSAVPGALKIVRAATFTVAASNASAAMLAAADYVCTGTADDAQVRAAIAALPSWGGRVLLSDGQLNFATPVELNKSNVLIEGAGIQSTTVAVTPGANCNAFQYTGSAAIIFCSLRNMLINGNSTTLGFSTNTTGYGIYIQPSGAGTFWDFHVRDVFAVHIAQDGFFAYDGHGYVLDHFLAEICTGAAVRFANPGPTGAAPPEVRNGTFKNTAVGIIMGIQGGVVAENEIQIITGDGIQLTGSGSKATDNWIGSCTGNGITMTGYGSMAKGNLIGSNTGTAGIAISTGPGTILGNYIELNSGYGVLATDVGSVVSGNTIGGNTLAGVSMTTQQGIIVSGNYIYQNGQQGISCTAAVGLISGNSLTNNSQTTINTYDEIQVTNNGAVVTGNIINGNSQSRYGINFSNGASVNQVASENNISNMATAATNSATTSVRWLSNTGVGDSPPATGERAPADLSFLAWTYDPALMSNNSLVANGVIYLFGVKLYSPQTITNLSVFVPVVAVTPTASQNWLALVDSTGAVRGKTTAGQIDSATTTVGVLTAAMSASYAAPAGRYWVAALFNAATAPQLGRGVGFATAPNLGLTAANYWYCTNGTGATVIPASFTPASNSLTNILSGWAAVS